MRENEARGKEGEMIKHLWNSREAFIGFGAAGVFFSVWPFDPIFMVLYGTLTILTARSLKRELAVTNR